MPKYVNGDPDYFINLEDDDYDESLPDINEQWLSYFLMRKIEERLDKQQLAED